MTEPVLIKHTFLVAAMAVLETVAPPIVASGALLLVAHLWQIRLTATLLAVTLSLVFVLLARPPRNLSSQLQVQPYTQVAATVLRWLLLIAVLAIIGSSSGQLRRYPAAALTAWTLATPLALVCCTLVLSRAMQRALISAVSSRKVIFAGYNQASVNIARALSANPALRLQVEGYFDDREARRLRPESGAQLLGRLAELADYVRRHGIDVIYIALPIRHVQRVLALLDDLRDTTASIYYVPDIFVFDLIQARSGEINGFPVVAMCETPFHGYRAVVKRVIDIAISVGVLTICSPLLLVIGMLVRFSSPGPVLFRQRRYGLDGQEIVVYKFRTMIVAEDDTEVRQASACDQRITPIGRVLRRFSLDELPQFINVLQGRMSVVGPRPHAVVHNEQYRKLIKGYMVRHKVLPGITGLAQINGARGETAKLEEMERRIEHDLDYLRRWSPMLDIKILLLTALKVFRDEKAY